MGNPTDTRSSSISVAGVDRSAFDSDTSLGRLRMSLTKENGTERLLFRLDRNRDGVDDNMIQIESGGPGIITNVVLQNGRSQAPLSADAAMQVLQAGRSLLLSPDLGGKEEAAASFTKKPTAAALQGLLTR